MGKKIDGGEYKSVRRNIKSSLSDKFEKLLSHLREQVCVAEIHLGVVGLLVVCKLIVMHVVIS